MKILSRGAYLGAQIDSLSYKNIIISKTDYKQKGDQDWHSHENSFFAYFLKGGNREIRNSREIKCMPGTLLFYRAGEIHCNKEYTSDCRIFHVEIDKRWSNENSLMPESKKVDEINDLLAKNVFIQLISEFAIRDELSESSIQNLVLYLFNLLARNSNCQKDIPLWKNNFDRISIEELIKQPSLKNVSKKLNIHPVTLSREFPKYYNCSFGEYVRRLRIEKSLPMLAKKSIRISDIAECIGFSEPGNFIRCFKKQKGTTPDKYRKLL